MRRSLFLPLAAALLVLTTAATASADLRPIRLPRNGDTLQGRIRVIVGLRLPPLAQAYGPGLFEFGPRKKLDIASRSSQAYLAQISRAQAVAARQIRRAVPSARISYHYRIVLDGMTVSLRYRDLPRLMRVGAVQKVFPSARYHLDTNKSPSVIHADTFWANTGGFGQNVSAWITDGLLFVSRW